MPWAAARPASQADARTWGKSQTKTEGRLWTKDEFGLVIDKYSENFEAAYDDEGLAQMVWENPAQVYDMSDEYVFLLPFTDILHTFQEEAADVHQNDAAGQEQSMQKVIRITSIRLGYMWIPDASEEMSGLLISVWDFMGNYISRWQGNEEQGIEDSWGANDSPYQSFLTVNAMDGTVVKGYERPY